MRITAKQAKRMSLNGPESCDELSVTCLAIQMAAQKGWTHIECNTLSPETRDWLVLNGFQVYKSTGDFDQSLITWWDAQI